MKSVTELEEENRLLKREVRWLRSKLDRIRKRCKGGFTPFAQRDAYIIADRACNTSPKRLNIPD